jgi:Fuc2NAc and GlcNAc transferase
VSVDVAREVLPLGQALLGTAAIAALTCALTAAARRYATRRAIFDVPNARSSHARPTPRGGGLAIVATTQLAVLGLATSGRLAPGPAAAFAGGGLAIAAVGWLDDRSGLGAPVRLLVHVLAAAWAVAWLGGLPALSLGSTAVPLGAPGAALASLGIVWAVNFYNFMDGIDGIAAGEALVAGAAGGALLLAAGQPGLAALALALAAAAAGFLVWNWAPARIFMGDVGSGYLGFMFGALAVGSENAGGPPVLAWAVLLGVFLGDATVTLVRRVVRGERWYAAHRTHAYQRAVDCWHRHEAVTGGVLALSVLLALLAWWGTAAPAALPGAVGAAAALVVGAYWAVERRRPMPQAKP